MRLTIPPTGRAVPTPPGGYALPDGSGALVPTHVPLGVNVVEHLRGERGAIIDALLGRGVGFVVILDDRVGLFSDWSNRRRTYWSWSAAGVTVGDELAAFPHHDVDEDALRLLPVFRFVPPPVTPLKGVHKVPAGRASWLSRDDGRLLESRHYVAEYVASADAPGDVHEILTRAIAASPAGKTTVFLSGGFDSTLLAALAKQSGLTSSAYTISYPSFSGRLALEEARASADFLKLELQVVQLDEATFAGALDSVLASVDEPFADIATVAETVLAVRARGDGWTCALEGEGADSAFGGSYKFILERYAPILRQLRVLRPLLAHASQNRRGALAEIAMKFNAMLNYWSDTDGFTRGFNFLQEKGGPAFGASAWPEVRDLYRSLYAIGGNDRLNAAAAMTVWGVIPYLENRKLEAVERAGIRLVLPFLTPELIRTALRVPARDKVRRAYGKHVLREQYATILPPHVQSRRKLSFTPPVAEWILKDRREVLFGNRVMPQERVRQLVDEHVRGRRDYTALIWGLYCGEHWLDLRSRAALAEAADRAAPGATATG